MSWGLTIDDIGGDVVIDKVQNIAMPDSVEKLLASNPHVSLSERNNGGRLSGSTENSPSHQSEKNGQKKPVTSNASMSSLEAEFIELWTMLDGPLLHREWQFHNTRKWRFDFAQLDTLVAIEIEGGVWSKGRHTRGAGFIGDCIKYNQAALDGWSVFRLTTGMITHEHVQPIIDNITTSL